MSTIQETSVETEVPQRQENTFSARRYRGHALVRCMTFIDGSWLYHNQEMLVKAYGAPYKIDFSKINVVALKLIRSHLADTLGTEAPTLDLVRTYYYASVPSNVHPDDAVKLEDQRKFYTMLSESLGFELVLHEIDFRGHYMAMQDRLEKESEPNFMPKERTVDMALGVGMLYLAAIDAYDIAIAVLGDADYQPALDRVRQLGKRILIFTIEGSAAYDYLYPRPNVRFADFPVVRFQDHLRELRLTPKQDRERVVYQYSCAKCGKEFYSTYKAPPRQNMYCDEHRIWREREPSYAISTNNQMVNNNTNGARTMSEGAKTTIMEELPNTEANSVEGVVDGPAELEKPTTEQQLSENTAADSVVTAQQPSAG
ncbi:MAG: NYN domain-containing protein [candidate division KSB1 bacterium]|nr:NYN domain-containing protein [candidate division KSB1 bacterium]MDZ7301428.1 NYN domain-containing protein [candidate division KSB1 bacterium]MDZ7313460.1 NYN domain-containing protein [candidate division KSB1 bacterium]